MTAREVIKVSDVNAEMRVPKGIARNDIISYAYRGSHSHGMYIPPTEPTTIDDIDMMGVFIAPVSNYFGISRNAVKETIEIKEGQWDIVYYEIRKFFHLLLKNNPNVLCMLFLHPDDRVIFREPMQRIVENKHWFISRLCAESFMGYAYSQLKRMERYQFYGYMGPKRRALVEKYGYDTKNAAHLIRLLRMGHETITTGIMDVRRPDAEELLSIKRGEWNLEDIKAEAERMFPLMKAAIDGSPLPKEPDYFNANMLLVSILSDRFHLNIAVPGRGRIYES